MHTVTQLKTSMFDIAVDGAPAKPADVFPGWLLHDRLGVVIDTPLGGLGATHLIQLAITSFYDAAERRRGALTVYPEIFAFHFGKPRGSHAAFDFWPARREVMLSDDPCDLLDAINDRGITRLAVPDRAPREFEYRPKEADTALDRIQSAFVYDARGRVKDGTIRIAGNHRATDINPGRVLRPVYLEKAQQLDKPFKEADTAYIRWLKLRATDLTQEQRDARIAWRDGMKEDHLVWETYRPVSVPDALAIMAGCKPD